MEIGGNVDWDSVAARTEAKAKQAAESATLKKREKGKEQPSAGARGAAEPFWLYETRMTVQRALIGRRGAVGATVFVGLVLLLVMSTSMSSIGLLQSYSYASALMEPTVRDAGAESNEYLEQQLRESMQTVAQLKESLQSVKMVKQVKQAVKANEPRVDATAKSVQRLQASSAPATSTIGSPRGSRAASAADVASRDERESVEDGGKPSVAAPAAAAAAVADHRPRAAAATPEGYVRPAHSKRKSDMFMAPQSVCPGKPSTVSLKKGAPTKPELLKEVKRRLDFIGDAIAFTPATPQAPEGTANASCLFITRPCAEGQQGAGLRAKLKIATDDEWDAFVRALPDIPERGLGSCAIVGNSDNMIGGGRGQEIDDHDTILRHNTPMRGFEKDVGSRRSIVYMKTKYTKKPPKGMSDSLKDVELALAELKDVTEVDRSYRGAAGKPFFLRSTAASKFARERRQLYNMMGYTGRRHPSGGFARPTNMLASKLCTRVDVYGFSGNMGGKYWARADKVMAAHVMDFEHWTYRYLMSQGKMCVYGD